MTTQLQLINVIIIIIIIIIIIKGYTLWLDNFYNSAALAKLLIWCNTVRGNHPSKHEGSVQETARYWDAERPGDSEAQRTSWCLAIACQEACNYYLERIKQQKKLLMVDRGTQIYFWNKTLHVSDSFSVHHQEFFTVNTAMVYTIAECIVKNSWWWTEELSETCRVLFQNYIWEISAPSWFYYKNLSRCTVTWTSQTCVRVCVIHYNQQIRGVDKKDQLLQMLQMERKRNNIFCGVSSPLCW